MGRHIKRTIIVLLIIIASLIGLIHFNYLSNLFNEILEAQIGEWGYFGVIFFVFILELVPQPFLSALIPLSIGIFFGLDIIYLVVFVVLFSISANYTAYFFGFFYGEAFAKLIISEKNYNKSIKLFEKYGKTSISFLALTPLPYFPVMGGIFKMTLKDFSLYAIIPRIIHFLVFSYLIAVFV